MAYTPRESFDDVFDAVVDLLDRGALEIELCELARRFLADNMLKLFRVVIGGHSTTGALEIGSAYARFEQSDLLLSLRSAILANDCNALAGLCHASNSLGSVASPRIAGEGCEG
jgi:hypothetical protein